MDDHLPLFYYYSCENSSLLTPQSGHTQSAGSASHFVPGATPLSGSPVASSYTYPHTPHTYFILLRSPFGNASFCLNYCIIINHFSQTCNIILMQFQIR